MSHCGGRQPPAADHAAGGPDRAGTRAARTEVNSSQHGRKVSTKYWFLTEHLGRPFLGEADTDTATFLSPHLYSTAFSNSPPCTAPLPPSSRRWALR